jgi:type IV secretion system protein VirB6
MALTFEWLGNAVDSALDKYLATTASAIGISLSGIIVLAMTIWLIWYAYETMLGRVQQPIQQVIRKFLLGGIVVAIGLGGTLYQTFVVDVAKDTQTSLINLVAGTSGATPLGALDGLDKKFAAAIELQATEGTGIISTLSNFSVTRFFIGLILIFAATIMMVFAAGYLLLAKVAIYALLSIGPLFIIALLFTPTARFFDAWLGQLMNYIFLTALVMLIVGVTVKITDFMFSVAPASLSLRDAVGVGVVSGAMVFLLIKVSGIATGLSGGSPLQGAGSFIASAIHHGARASRRASERARSEARSNTIRA